MSDRVYCPVCAAMVPVAHDCTPLSVPLEELIQRIRRMINDREQLFDDDLEFDA